MGHINEKALVGGLLQNPGKISDVAQIVKQRDFQDHVALRIFLIMLGLWKNGQEIDVVSVIDKDKSIAVYLAESLNVDLPANVVSYSRQISTDAKNRRISTELARISSNDYSTAVKLDDILTLYQKEVSVSSKNADIKDVLSRFENHVTKNKKRGSMGFSTGFDFLENKYIQYVPGHIWTIGGFTSVGKTAVMVQQICNLLENNEYPTVKIISTEMTEQQLTARIISNFTGVHSFRILTGNFRPGEEEIVSECKNELKQKKLTIHDDIYKLNDIETEFRSAYLRGGIDIGFIDYVQNCQVPDAKNSYQSGEMLAKGIQKLSKDTMSTIVCLSQVSNDVGRGNTDQLELKGAGEWAAVSDIGVMLHRGKNNKKLIGYVVKKNRHGALTEHMLEFKNDFSCLSEATQLNNGF